MKLTLGFSPCPNDTFIFDALVNGKIDTEGLSFEVQLEDVQTLNEWAQLGKLDFSKISYAVYPLIRQQYNLLKSGGALGKGVGPLLITKHAIQSTKYEVQSTKHEVRSTKYEDLQLLLNNSTIAIPGANTTAHFLFSQVFPEAKRKQFMVFHEIEDAVLNGIVDMGVIIHENRFTYQQKGLHKVMDLGEYWETTTGYPIPLGGIVANQRIATEVQLKVDRLIRKSVEYAFSKYPLLADYVKQHSQEMSEDVMRQHIDLYVNNYSLDIGEEGMQAIEQMLQTLSHHS